MKAAALILLSFFVFGCSSSKPAPKPVDWNQTVSEEQAKKILQDAELKQACSEQNLKNATKEQKEKCRQLEKMFDQTSRPAQPAQQPNTPQKR